MRNVDPSIWAVRFFNNSQVENQVPLPELFVELLEFHPIQSFASLVAGVLPFLEAPSPGGGPAVFDGAAHKSEVESDQLLVLVASAPNFGIVLLKFCCVVVDGLKLHVEDESISFGDVFAVLFPNKSDSLAALIDNGLRATLPGVIDGSSSMFFCVPYERNFYFLFLRMKQQSFISNDSSPSMAFLVGIQEPDL